ncbi:YdgA family protein [Halomonas sp. LR3S48]|uniref:YdgA family protein n=1 Tax=Halomonas sp. LR3S48 TaxID=2982694 RepID=UPI0021E3CE43|nr:YdgA family protein [Halomonas sp. LR3S48]UYG02657.1 YdgA family protein [Halomonas sp. LR3S48]
MRKERLIVPLLFVLLLAWLAGQAVSSWLFEREMVRTLADLEARGEIDIKRVEVEQGWLASSGRIHLAPLLGQTWQLELSYRARHGILSTHLDGEAKLRHGPDGVPLFGDSLVSSPPQWEASYHTLNGIFEGRIELSPLRITQQERELTFEGGRLRFSGEQGNWRLRAQLESWTLSDGAVRLEIGPATLNSQYAYTEDAHSFTQEDRLQIESLSWHQPQLELDTTALRLANRISLDDQELRMQLDLDLGEIHTAEQVLLTGQLEAELSRLNADAIRGTMLRLRELAASGRHEGGRDALLAELEPHLLATLQDSPRLDLKRLELNSPMLGLAARVDGSLFFDGRRWETLSLAGLEEPAVRERWRQRLDGDFTWHELPTVVALWLGLPLDTRTLEIDIGRGQVRVNSRPLPPLWR